jgi:hypothetical protein
MIAFFDTAEAGTGQAELDKLVFEYHGFPSPNQCSYSAVNPTL